MPSNGPVLLTDAINDVLLTSGPLTRTELFAHLRERGLSPSEVEFEDAWYSEGLPLIAELGVFEPEVFVRLDPMLVGRTFTHRVTHDDLETDSLLVDSDLEAALWLDDSDQFSTLDGQPIDERLDMDDLRLHLPAGRLGGFEPGDLIGLRVAADGFHLVPVPGEVPGFPDEVLDEVWSLFDVEIPRIGSVELVHHLLLRYPELLAEPMLPISEIFSGLGLDLDAATVRPTDGDWEESDDKDPAEEMADLIRMFHLTPEQAVAVLTFEAALDEWLDAIDPHRVTLSEDVATAMTRALPQMAHPSVAVALYAHYVSDDEDISEIVSAWARSAIGSAPRAAKAHLHWLIGRTADQRNNVDVAQAAYESALTVDPHSFLALRDLAARVSERGDAARAVSLLTRAGSDSEDTLFAMVSRYVTEDRHDLGRNDPCWCGSGQKYKRCHAGKTGFSLDQRVDWLYYKVALWVQDGAGMPLMTEIAGIRSHHWTDANAMKVAMDDPFVLDTTIFDGGYLARYLELRGHVLPDDEQLLAAAWLTSQRSLYEIESVRPGTGFTLRDLRTGDEHEVVERSGSRQLKRGQLISVRLLSGGGAPVIHGGIEPIPDHQRDAVLVTLDLQDSDAADPLRTMAVLSGRFAPPDVRAVGGDPIVFCRADLLVPPGVVDEFVDGLTGLYGASDEEHPREDGAERKTEQMVWDRTEPSTIGRRVLGSVRYDVDSKKWSLDAQTERRFDDLWAEVLALAPGVECGPVERIRPSDLSRRRPAGKSSTATPVPTDPAMAEVLEKFVRQHEERWVDEHIPALGGVTPREAVDDPTRRDELIRLLDSFDDYPSMPGTMNVDNLRRALGLLGG